MKTPPGRFVRYILSAEDVEIIDRDMPLKNNAGRVLRSPVAEGDVLHAVIVANCDSHPQSANLHVYLDGEYIYWAPSRLQEDFDRTGPGHWQSLVP